jgi:hypothetical protein
MKKLLFRSIITSHVYRQKAVEETSFDPNFFTSFCFIEELPGIYHLPTGDLDSITKVFKNRLNFLPMLTLDKDHTFLNCPSAAAGALEDFRQVLDIFIS